MILMSIQISAKRFPLIFFVLFNHFPKNLKKKLDNFRIPKLCIFMSDNEFEGNNMYSNGIRLDAHSYNSIVSSNSGSLSVPVKPADVIYTQLDYVQGRAAERGRSSVPAIKVRILNTLISQLVSMKKKDALNPDEIASLSDEQKDEMIKQFQEEVKTTIATVNAQPAPYGLAGVMPEPGAVVSFSI